MKTKYTALLAVAALFAAAVTSFAGRPTRGSGPVVPPPAKPPAVQPR